jgi:hypothetical protein
MSVITNNGFWPDIDSDDFIASFNSPRSFEVETLDYLLKQAIVKSNSDLKKVKAALLTDYADLAEYVADNEFEEIDNISLPEFHYKNAVYAYAKYQSLVSFPQLGMTIIAEKLADLDEPMKIELMSLYENSINYLFGVTAESYPDDTTVTDSNNLGVYLL